MAELKVVLSGDAKGLKRAAKEAAQVLSAAQAEVAAAAAQADRDIATSRKDAAKAEVVLAKQVVAERIAAAKVAGEADKAAARAAVDEARAVLQAKRRQYSEVAATAKAASQVALLESETLREAKRREIAEEKKLQAEIIETARVRSRENAKVLGGRGGAATGRAPGGASGKPGGSGDPIADIAKAFAPVAASFYLAVNALGKITSQLAKMNDDLVRNARSQEERLTANRNNLSYAGITGAGADRIQAAATEAAKRGTIKTGVLDSALETLGKTARGTVDVSAVEQVIAAADEGTVTGALTGVGQGLSAKASLSLAAKVKTLTRGQDLTEAQARSAKALVSRGGAFGTDLDRVAAFVAATGGQTVATDQEQAVLDAADRARAEVAKAEQSAESARRQKEELTRKAEALSQAASDPVKAIKAKPELQATREAKRRAEERLTQAEATLAARQGELEMAQGAVDNLGQVIDPRSPLLGLSPDARRDYERFSTEQRQQRTATFIKGQMARIGDASQAAVDDIYAGDPSQAIALQARAAAREERLAGINQNATGGSRVMAATAGAFTDTLGVPGLEDALTRRLATTTLKVEVVNRTRPQD